MIAAHHFAAANEPTPRLTTRRRWAINGADHQPRHQASSGVIRRHRASSGVIGLSDIALVTVAAPGALGANDDGPEATLTTSDDRWKKGRHRDRDGRKGRRGRMGTNGWE